MIILGVYVGFTDVTMERIFTEGIDPSVSAEVMLSGLGGLVLGTTLTVFIQITNIDTGGTVNSQPARQWLKAMIYI